VTALVHLVSVPDHALRRGGEDRVL